MRFAVAFVLLVLALTGLAGAQQSTGERDQPVTVLLDFGFTGELTAGEWAPVRVSVSPTDEAIEAVAQIRLQTPDGGQLTTIVPVTTTPGRETLVPTAMWIPPTMSAAYVDLLGAGGGLIASTSYGTFAGSQSVRLPTPSTAPLIVGVGSPTLRLAFGSPTYEREFFGPSGVELRERAATARVASSVPSSLGGPPWLPATAIAYNGVTAVVVDGQLVDRLDPAGVLALREWVVSGGRLMLVNADNSALGQLLGEHVPRGLDVLAGSEVDLPAALGGPGEVVSRSIDSASLPAGWSSLEAAPQLCAQGPVGLGWLMVLGFDPDVLADEGLIAGTETAWHASLAAMIAEELEAGQRRLGSGSWEASTLRQLATNWALAWVSRAPTVGIGAFVAIFAMMVGLAVALGPVDRFVLGRLGLLHRWWLAALGWIALATVGAWLAPNMVRSGPTTVSSVRVIDGLAGGGAASLAWQHGIDGLFLNRSAQISLDDLDEGAWLSPLSHQYMPGSVGTLTMTPRGRTMRPQPTAARLWTTRTFEQQGAVGLPIEGSFEIENERLTLRLMGSLAEVADVAAVHTGGQWLELLPGDRPRREGDAVVFRATRNDLAPQAPDAFDLSGFSDAASRWHWWVEDPTAPAPALLTQIGRAERRTKAFEALAQSDSWAVVYLSWRDATPLIGSDVGEEFDNRLVCRVAVPVVRKGVSGGTR